MLRRETTMQHAYFVASPTTTDDAKLVKWCAVLNRMAYDNKRHLNHSSFE